MSKIEAFYMSKIQTFYMSKIQTFIYIEHMLENICTDN